MSDHAPEVDEKDLEILAAIGELQTSNSKKIAEKSGIPTSTVHYRLQQLEERGVLKNGLFEVDLEKVGLSVTVISEVFAEFEEGYHERIGTKLAEMEGVDQVYFTMGDTDFIVISHLQDREMVKSLVENFETIDGIERTSSKFVIEPVKYSSFPIANYDFETLQSMISDP